MIKRILICVLAGITLSGCSASGGQARPEESATAAVQPAPSVSPVPGLAGRDTFAAPDSQEDAQENMPYIDRVVQDTIAKFVTPGMTEYEKAKAAFDYLIENTSLDDPVGLDLWRIRGGGEAPSFVENRSLSVLLYGVGMCEDYAAALTMLLRGMGIEAQYMPGLTYSAKGQLVDHAWTIAKIDGVWYHLDSQLEDNISRHGAIRYRYFMRGDATMGASHFWGQNLIRSGLLTAEQNEEIARAFMGEACPQDYPRPAPRRFTAAPAPDLEAAKADIAAEFSDYEAVHGALTPLELDIVPPVFALDGFGPDE